MTRGESSIQSAANEILERLKFGPTQEQQLFIDQEFELARTPQEIHQLERETLERFQQLVERLTIRIERARTNYDRRQDGRLPISKRISKLMQHQEHHHGEEYHWRIELDRQQFIWNCGATSFTLSIKRFEHRVQLTAHAQNQTLINELLLKELRGVGDWSEAYRSFVIVEQKFARV
jgi:hypothetical protein